MKQEKEFVEIKNALTTQKYTKVHQEKEFQYNAPHLFIVEDAENEKEIARIHFQEGPIQECGINGVANEDLLAMVVARLEGFQNSPYACKENEMALDKLYESLMWLRKRTMQRELKGIEGTHKIG